MLDLPRYLLGVAEIALLVGFAWAGAASLRARLLPTLSGAPAHLATAVLALALLLWIAEILGTVGLFKPAPYLVGIAVVGFGLWLGLGGGLARPGPPSREVAPVALAIAALAFVKFGLEAKSKLSTGMTGFDSTWYHGPFAAGFFQSGNTWNLHFIAPQFLAWFYPANAEIFHAAGMLAFGRDLLSPLLNLGWFVGCLAACWCIGRPHRVASWSLALGAIALSLPVLSDQAGEARNDIVGIFFLLAAVAIALNERAGRRQGEAGLGMGALAVIGLAAGLAAGTKLNFLLPAAVLVLGLAVVAPAGRRWRALGASGLAALAGGGYWYLRNLIHTGNPLPWFDLGPISLPTPDQSLGGREGHSVLGYVTDGSVWSDWFLPGLHGGLTVFWPLLLACALAGLLLCLIQPRGSLVAKKPRSGVLGEGRDQALLLAGLTGMAVVVAWLIAPTSASGPDGMARGFESGLRYLAPAIVLGLALLPATPPLRHRLARLVRPRSSFVSPSDTNDDRIAPSPRRRRQTAFVVGLAALFAIAICYPVQRHYLQNRYANPSFAAPGLNSAFKWAGPISGARIATTSTRQYPLYGTDLSNHVQFIGEERPHGGFVAPTTCRQWRRLIDAGDYDYVVASWDRIEPDKSTYPQTARWTKAPGSTVVLREPPTVVFKLTEPLDPSTCRK
ncbi:MAG TPA: hypothetical protein VLK89_02995 [Solirubrobacterales bacterium]|nr:hypothetical protein [Solirubrobacterales bacterium]